MSTDKTPQNSDLALWPLIQAICSHPMRWDGTHWWAGERRCSDEELTWLTQQTMIFWGDPSDNTPARFGSPARFIIASATLKTFWSFWWLDAVSEKTPVEQRLRIMGSDAQALARDRDLPMLSHNPKTLGALWHAEIVRATHLLHYDTLRADLIECRLSSDIMEAVSAFGVRFQEWTSAEKWIRHRNDVHVTGGCSKVEFLPPEPNFLLRLKMQCARRGPHRTQARQTVIGVSRVHEYEWASVRCSCKAELKILIDPFIIQKIQAHRRRTQQTTTNDLLFRSRHTP